MASIPATIEAPSSTSVILKGSPDSSTSATTPPSASEPTATNKNHHRYKDWFRPKRWSIRRSPSAQFLPPSSSQDTADLSRTEQHKKDLEELNAATWNRQRRIALFDPFEIKIEDAISAKRICIVDRIELEQTAEYLQQEKHRLQLQVKSMGQVYSLKRIPPTAVSPRAKRKALRLLVQEATVLAKLGDHPNIIALRGLPFKSCNCNDFFLLTDRLHPDTLERRIQLWREEGKSSLTATWDPYLELYGGDDDTVATPNDDTIPLKTNYAFQIAKALQACHKAGIVVRDLSPHTIGFRHDDPDCIQLFDLGHAQVVVDDASATAPKAALVGKRRYLAGEIWKTGQYSFKTDVYSWAMIYYEMCMERKPFMGYSVNEHEKYVWDKGDRPLLAASYLPAGIDKLLMSAWAHHPEERLDIDQVCYQTQTLLMNLDSCLFWDQGESDFLFDLFVPKLEDDEISAMGEGGLDDADQLTEAESSIFEQSDGNLSSCPASTTDSEKATPGSSLGEARPYKLISSAA